MPALLLARRTLKSYAVQDPNLLPLYFDDSGLLQFSQGRRGRLSINAQMFRNLLVRHVVDNILDRSFQQQAGHARNQIAEGRCVQVHQHMDKSAAHQIKESPRNNGILPQKLVQLGSWNNPNSCCFGCLCAAVIPAISNASHFTKHGGRLQFRDNQPLCPRWSEGLHRSSFEKEQSFATFTRLKENVPCRNFPHLALRLSLS